MNINQYTLQIRQILIILCLAFIVQIIMGCGTTGKKSSKNILHLSVTSNGIIILRGKTISLNNLEHKLKTLHLPSKTSVTISTAGNISDSLRISITTALASTGLRKIMFIGPKRAQAFLRKNKRRFRRP